MEPERKEEAEPRIALFRRTIFVRKPNGRFQMRKDTELLRFEDLKDDELLTAGDLQKYFRCGLRTLRRWFAQDGLRPDGFYKKQLLFYKGAVLRWERSKKPKRGRPRLDPGKPREDPIEALRRRLLGPSRTSIERKKRAPAAP